MKNNLKTVIQYFQTHTILSPQGYLKDESLQELKSVFKETVKKHQVPILIDLSKVPMISSSVVSFFMHVYESLSSPDLTISLVHVSHPVKNVLKSVNLTACIPIFNTREEYCAFLLQKNETQQKTREESSTSPASNSKLRVESPSSGFHSTPDINFTEHMLEESIDSRIILHGTHIEQLTDESILGLALLSDKIKQNNSSILLVNVPDHIMRLCEALNVKDKFSFFNSLEDAVFATESVCQP